MSENQLIQRSQKKIQQEEDDYEYAPIIDIFEPQFIPQPKLQEKLKKFYYPLEFPFCGDYQQPDLKEVQQKKKRLGLPFIENQQHQQKQKLMNLDGTYEQNVEIDSSSPQIIRLKTRMARDGKQQFFQKTGEFVVQKQFFQQQMARLANISYQENLCLKSFHKNAILSERNNQKKNTSFQLLINFGGVFINKHPLQNDEQKKFQQIKPLMKQWAMLSTYPILPQLSKQIDYLKQMQQIISQNVGSTRGREELFEIQKKLRICEDLYEKERRRIQQVAKGIIYKWKEVKDIRTSTGLTTVPWKINIKQYEINDQVQGRMIKNFDIGMIPFEIERLDMNQSQLAVNQKNRRNFIQQEKYFLKVIINGNEVARTQKFLLQWPSYKVPIHEQLSITVYSAPYQVAVQIVKSGFINQVIDTVNLSLPGANSRTITASEKKFAIAGFASNGKQTRNKKQKQQAKAPAGNLLYMMEWKGQGSRMPPSIFAKVGQEDTQSTQASQALTDRFSELDISQKQIKGLFDVKDPRQQKSIKEKVENEINQGSNALLPFSHVQSTRLLFLRLRNRIGDLQKIQIPLLEEQFDKRQDLREILERQRRRNKAEVETQNHKYFHPCQNKYFNQQQPAVLSDIRALLQKVQGLKLFNSSRGLSISSSKYKIAEQIINEHIFQQMESPIVIFFKDLFTQKRKLGPKSTYKAMPRLSFDDVEINIHVRNARNMPIRSNAEESINQFQKAQKMVGGMMGVGMGGMGMNQGMGMMGMAMGGGGMYPQQGGMFSNNRDMYSNYGAGLFNMRPTFTMTGHTFFTQNQNNPNRLNQQASYEGKSMQRVNTVVQLKFKKVVKRTTAFEGPFPEWNQTLTFKYEIKKQNSSIEKIFYNNQKLMKLLVFDITQESKPTNAIAKIEIKKTKYYLGRIQIPFSLITIIPSLTGIWRLDRPLVTFSYGIMKREILGNDIPGQNNMSYNEPRSDIPTSLNIDMFTQPLIDSFIAYNTDRKFIVGPQENPLLLQKASDWIEDLNTKRFVKLWLNDINQKSIFICRYLSKTVAPPKFDFNPIEKTARFVSLIPRKYNCQMLQNTEQFHLNVDEFLKLKMGQDHGILLCNYFNFIDAKNHLTYESYLVLGKAFPYGKSIFVLRRDKQTNNCEIWDPFKGDCYVFPGKQYQMSCFCIKTEKKQQINYTGHNICPMFEVTCIVSKDNVYVNRQQTTNPYTIDFTLQNDKLWFAFLSQRTRTEYFTTKQIPTIQPQIDQNYYTENFPESRQIPADIQKQLFDFIRSKIEQQRKNHFTPLVFKLNTKVSKKISETLLLQQCQTFKSDFRMTGKDSKMYESAQLYYTGLKQLEQQKINITNTILDSDKNLYGFTMNFTFTTFDEIWQKIEDTQVHLDENQNIEFVLSVKCFPYTCQLFSVWVFIGSIQ